MSILRKLKFPQSDEFLNPISFARLFVLQFLCPVTGTFFQTMEKQGAPYHVRKPE
jgi:hypothetical protein